MSSDLFGMMLSMVAFVHILEVVGIMTLLMYAMHYRRSGVVVGYMRL